MSNLRLFAGNAHPALAKAIAHHAGVPLGEMMITRFNDGEIRVQVEESARGNDIFIVQPTSAPVNDNLMELLIMVDAFRRASAQKITVVLPYYGYARQDKKIKPREPVTARLVADLLESSGVTRAVCVDLHAAQIQGFFRIPVDHLYAGPLLADYLTAQGYVDGNTCVVSPDVGGVARASALAETLKTSIAIIAKRRPEVGRVEIVEIIGDVRGKRCVLIDDMIDTGGTIAGAVRVLKEHGAKDVIIAATHAVFSDPAAERLSSCGASEVVVTNTLPLRPEQTFENLTVLSIAPLLARAIKEVFDEGSVTSLFDGRSN